MQAPQLGLVLVVACLVAIVSRRLRLPYSVGLVVAGMLLSLAGPSWQVRMTPHLIYAVLLPPLIYEAALQLKWAPFRAALPVTLTLAFPGVAIAASIIGLGMRFAAGWTWGASLALGTLIAATDPVSVIALFRAARVPPRLRHLVEAESLMNDGTAAVGFAVVVGIAGGAALHPGLVAWQLVWMVGFGLAAGAACAGAALLLAGRTDDPLVEITLTTITAYGGFSLAEHFGASGVLAAMAAGLVTGNLGPAGPVSEEGRRKVIAFWDYAAFLANSVVFILIGGHEAREGERMFTAAAGIAILLMLISRVATIYPLCALFARTRFRVATAHQHVLVWGGLRGALALALALSVPDAVAGKDQVVAAAFAVVAFSIFVQGLSMNLVLRRLRLETADG